MTKILKQASLVPLAGSTDGRATISTSIVDAATILTTTADCTHVLLDVQAQPVMVTFDTSAPTSTNGHLLAAGYNNFDAPWPRQLFAAARFIRQGGTDGTIHASELCY